MSNTIPEDKTSSISQPKWKQPSYSKKEINDAGEIVRNADCPKEKWIKALTVIDDWRASHAYPMHVFYINLRHRAERYNGAIVAERLKRLHSIVGKLQREKEMRLYRMQDLGGCRVILPSIQDVNKFKNALKESRIRHLFKRESNYIDNPKESGYRSIHHIYQFQTDSPKLSIFNDYVFEIEIQFRTFLQHLWATAVEIIGLIEKENYKASQGNQSIRRFFVLVSSLFAIKEGTPTVPNTPQNPSEIITELKEIDKEMHIMSMLSAIRVSMDVLLNHEKKVDGYVVLELKYDTHALRMLYFKPNEIDKANKYYDRREKNNDNVDVVLVRTTSYKEIKKAYPNYFLDISTFISLIKDYFKAY